jgi:hypothetical protein
MSKEAQSSKKASFLDTKVLSANLSCRMRPKAEGLTSVFISDSRDSALHYSWCAAVKRLDLGHYWPLGNTAERA